MNEPEVYKRYPFNLFAYFTRGIIWTQRKAFFRPIPSQFKNVDEVNEEIAAALAGDKSFMAARFGSVEMDAFSRRFDDLRGSCVAKILGLLTGRNGPWWFDNSVRRTMNTSAGFFPPDDNSLRRFHDRVAGDCALMDINASWYGGEERLKAALYPNARTCTLGELNPFFATQPWTKALKGRKILLVHPFEQTILRQYARRRELFDDPEFLPDFQLLTYKPVVSHCAVETGFDTWFDALALMEREITALDFDIAILGCGAYGMSLAAAIKRAGRKAIHLGGVTQLLFGIKGRRWDNTATAARLYRDSWCRPDESERPARSDLMENNCYW